MWGLRDMVEKIGRAEVRKNKNEHRVNPFRNSCLMFIERQCTSRGRRRHIQYPKRPRINSEICKHLNLRLWILHYWLRFAVPTALVCSTLWTLYLRIGESLRQSDHFTTLKVSYSFRANTIRRHETGSYSHRRLADETPTEVSFMRPTAVNDSVDVNTLYEKYSRERDEQMYERKCRQRLTRRVTTRE